MHLYTTVGQQRVRSWLFALSFMRRKTYTDSLISMTALRFDLFTGLDNFCTL